MRAIRHRWLSVLLLLVCVAANAGAQNYPYKADTTATRGVMPNSYLLDSPVDHVDPVSGNLHIEVPLASLPKGDAGSGFNLSLVYNSHLYDADVDRYPTQNVYLHRLKNQFIAGGGWNYNFENIRLSVEQRYIPSWSTSCNDAGLSYSEHERTFRYRIVLADGSAHILHLRGIRGDDLPNEPAYWGDGFYGINMAGVRSVCASLAPNLYSSQDTTGLLTYYTTDGSYLRLEKYTDSPYWFLYMPDGTEIIGDSSQPSSTSSQVNVIYDANAYPNPGHPEGNRVEFFRGIENGHSVIYIKDAYDRSIRIEKGYISEPRQDRITVAGPNGTLEWRVTWKAFTQNYQYGCAIDPNTSQDIYCSQDITNKVVEYVQLPIGAMQNPGPEPPAWSSYKFTYNETNFGFLNSMRTPGGAQYVYSYHYLYTYLDTETTSITSVRVQARDVYHDGNVTPDHWSWSPTHTTSIMTAPDGGQTVYSFYDDSFINTWYRALVWKIQEPGGKVTKRQWTRNTTYGLQETISTDPNNPYVERESVTVGTSISAVTDYLYDKNGNLKKKIEYDWGTYVSGAPMDTPGSVVRTTEWTYFVDVPDDTPANASPNPADAYWNGTAGRRLNAVKRRTVKDGTTVKAATEFEYDNPRKGANVTRELRWDDTKNSYTVPLTAGNSVEFRRDYSRDANGNFDGRGNLTKIYGADILTEILYPPASPYPNQVKYGVSDNGFRSFTYSWNVTAGTLSSSLDNENGITTSYDYDAAGRLATLVEAGRHTTTVHDDVNRKITVEQDRATNGDEQLLSVTEYDQLGRAVLVRSSDRVSPTQDNHWNKVQTIYRIVSGSGLHVLTSTPYRDWSDPTLEWTCTMHDQQGRVERVAVFEGGDFGTGIHQPQNCASTSHRTGLTQINYDVESNMARTKTIDPAGKSVAHRYDALGRLKHVVEDPDVSALLTTYVYNVLDALTDVWQTSTTGPQGSVTQHRVFVYTSLGRLKTATNPETGAINYEYKDWGDLKTRLDARNITTTFDYDDLHRIKSKTYNDGVTPNVAYAYHTAAPQAGQLLSVSASLSGTTVATTTYGAYDSQGRVLTHSQQITGAGTYNFSYQYWANGQLKIMLYPSGRALSIDIDGAGRTAKVAATSPGARLYADTTQALTPFTPDGRLSQMQLGNSLWETRDYHTSGTATALKLGTTAGSVDKLELIYNYSPTANNGNLLSHVIHQGASYWSQTYGYDSLNRLMCAVENTGSSPAGSCATYTSWQQTFAYDRFGNRWVPSSSGFSPADVHESQLSAESNIDKYTNRVAGLGYDNAGNLTSYSPWVMEYDAENRMRNMTSTSNGSSSFVYDGEGRRIKKTSTIFPAASQTYYIYDAFGKLAAEYSTLAPASTGTSYMFEDLLGTPRAITASNGSLSECSDYSPFGRLLNAARSQGCYGTPSRASQQFTGQVRDQETKIDYFGARYYSGAQGRFLSADSPFADQHGDEPQSWNLYSYVRNKPLGAVDLDGRQMSMMYPTHNGTQTFTGLGKAWINEHLRYDTNLSQFFRLAGIGWQSPDNGHQQRAMERYPAVKDAILLGVAIAGIAGRGETPGSIKVESEAVSAEITLSRTRHGEAATHAADAIKAGKPDMLTIDRLGTAGNRQASTGALEKVPGKHLDEYPPAMFKEGGAGASVRPINPRDNMSAGACIGNSCRQLPDGTKIKIKIED